MAIDIRKLKKKDLRVPSGTDVSELTPEKLSVSIKNATPYKSLVPEIENKPVMTEETKTPDVSMNTNFNDGKKIKVTTAGGDVIDFTPDEYKGYIGGGTGKPITEKGEKLREYSQDLVIKRQLAEQMRMEKLKRDFSKVSNIPYDASPMPLVDDKKPSGFFDVLDLGAVGGGAAGGAMLGKNLGPIGAIAGGIIGAGTAFFTSQAAEQRQFSKDAFTRFSQATTDAQKIQNNANAGYGTPEQNRLFMENTIDRIKQSQRELKAQSDGLFGDKLSRNQDERAKIEGWLRRWEEFGKQEFEMSLISPDANKIDTSLIEKLPTEI